MRDEKFLKYQMLYRGTREGDLLFHSFFQDHGESLTRQEVQGLRLLLQETDQDILSWVVGRLPKPAWLPDALFNKIKASLIKQ